MRGLFVSSFFLRFAGGFVIGAAAVGGLQLVGWVEAVARVA